MSDGEGCGRHGIYLYDALERRGVVAFIFLFPVTCPRSHMYVHNGGNQVCCHPSSRGFGLTRASHASNQ